MPNYDARIAEFRKREGLEDDMAFEDALAEWVIDSVVPSVCQYSCEIEADGRCEHGCPSILRAMGLV